MISATKFGSTGSARFSFLIDFELAGLELLVILALATRAELALPILELTCRAELAGLSESDIFPKIEINLY
jgi:hypothetical protein